MGQTVPYSQQQNYAEGEGGNFKFALVQHLMHLIPHAPMIVYWCFAASFLDKTQCHLPKQRLMDVLLLRICMVTQMISVSSGFHGSHQFGTMIQSLLYTGQDESRIFLGHY